MKSNRKTFLSLSAVLLAGGFSAFGATAPPEKTGIIRTHGAGFYEIKPNGLKVLHLKGTGYERGYQYGAMLKDEIEESLKSGMTMFALYIGKGKHDHNYNYEKGMERIKLGAEEMEPFIPTEFINEMKGMAKALEDAGSDLTYEDILMWNTINDTKMLAKGPCLVEDRNPPGKRIPYFPRGGCLSASASRDATADGSMIVGKNFDWYATPEMRKHPLVLVVEPTDGGHSYLSPAYPGWICCIEGLNDQGISTGLQISRSDYETMKGVGWHFMTALLLKYSDSIDDAINILTVYPRPCGNIFQICNGKTGDAAVVETTANALAVRYPQDGKNILWTANHFNCIKGWQGYDGPVNMPSQQVKAYKLDLGSIETWQKTIPIWTIGRYDRTRQLLNENYGKITVDTMRDLVSDRFCMKAKKHADWDKLDTACIADMWAHDTVLSKNIQYYKSTKTAPLTYSGAAIWSLVMVPKTGDVDIAMAGEVPAQRGGFKHINLFDELKEIQKGKGTSK